MSLLDSATQGLIGALVTALGAYGLHRRSRPRAAQADEAWKRQVDDLQRRLENEHDESDRQQQEQIRYLRRELGRANAEITRLQRLLGRTQQGGSAND